MCTTILAKLPSETEAFLLAILYGQEPGKAADSCTDKLRAG